MTLQAFLVLFVLCHKRNILKSLVWNLHSINVYKNSILEFPLKPLFLLSFFLRIPSFSVSTHPPSLQKGGKISLPILADFFFYHLISSPQTKPPPNNNNNGSTPCGTEVVYRYMQSIAIPKLLSILCTFLPCDNIIKLCLFKSNHNSTKKPNLCNGELLRPQIRLRQSFFYYLPMIQYQPWFQVYWLLSGLNSLQKFHPDLTELSGS